MVGLCVTCTHPLHEEVYLILGRCAGCRVVHRVLHVSRLYVEVGELRLEPVHDCRYLFQVHCAHGDVHALHDFAHRARYAAHGDCSLDARGDGIDAAAQAEQVEALVLFPDGVCSVDLCALLVALCECLLQLVELLLLVLARLGRLLGELFRRELEREQRVCNGGGSESDEMRG